MQPNFNFLMFNNLERKKRNRPTVAQSKGLERAFQEDNKPSREIKLQLSHDLGISMPCIQIWFQNRRAKSKNLIYKNKKRPTLPKTYDGISIPANRRRFLLPSMDLIRPSQYLGSDPYLYHLVPSSPASSSD